MYINTAPSICKFCAQRSLTAPHDKCLFNFRSKIHEKRTEISGMSDEKEKTSVSSTKPRASAVPAEWKMLNKIHSDPLVERLIHAAQRENVATEMITILGNYDNIISLD